MYSNSVGSSWRKAEIEENEMKVLKLQIYLFWLNRLFRFLFVIVIVVVIVKDKKDAVSFNLGLKKVCSDLEVL